MGTRGSVLVYVIIIAQASSLTCIVRTNVTCIVRTMNVTAINVGETGTESASER